MEELNKDLTPGATMDNTANAPVENNHVNLEPEPAFSDEEEEMPLRSVVRLHIYFLFRTFFELIP